MGSKRTISKAKGVEMVANWLFAGKTRKEIGQELAKLGNISESGTDKWIKAARPVVAERQAQAKVIQERVDKEQAEASAKRLNLTKERLLEELGRIAYWDPRKMYTIDGGLKPVNEWGDDEAAAVGTVESFDVKTEIKEGSETVDSVTTGTNKKVKTWDKIRAIENICKILGYNAPEKKDLNVNLTDGPITFE